MIVCNGYKDEEFMRLALMGQRLGHKVFIVIEQLSEIDVLLQVGRRAGRRPRRPASASSCASAGFGRWAQSGGEQVEVRADGRAAGAGDRPADRGRDASTSSS